LKKSKNNLPKVLSLRTKVKVLKCGHRAGKKFKEVPSGKAYELAKTMDKKRIRPLLKKITTAFSKEIWGERLVLKRAI